MKILFTICGRAGSKGFKNKNLSDFNGIPLVYYSLGVINSFREKYAGVYDCDIVSTTDSGELSALIQRAEPSVFPVARIPELSGDQVRKIDAIRDAARRAEVHFGKQYDMVVDLDITSPMRTLKDLEAVVERRKVSEADVVYTVTEGRRNPWFTMVNQKESGFYSTVMPSAAATRQETPPVFDMNGSIYGYTPEYIHDDQPLFLKGDIVIMRDTGFLDIDSREDFEMMQVIAAYLFEHDPDFAAVRAAAKRILDSVKE